MMCLYARIGTFLYGIMAIIPLVKHAVVIDLDPSVQLQDLALVLRGSGIVLSPVMYMGTLKHQVHGLPFDEILLN
jgi:hypothetical protein